jgi:hypothetical protein
VGSSSALYRWFRSTQTNLRTISARNEHILVYRNNSGRRTIEPGGQDEDAGRIRHGNGEARAARLCGCPVLEWKANTLEQVDINIPGWMVVVFLLLYFAPSMIGALRRVPDVGLVIGLNLALGWTVIGWFVALVLACRPIAPPQQTTIEQPPAASGLLGSPEHDAASRGPAPVAIIAVLAIGVLVTVAVSNLWHGHASPTTVSCGSALIEIGGTTLPDGFPDCLPIPDGTTLVDAHNYEYSYENGYSVWLSSDQSLDELRTFYQENLPRNGWTIRDKVEAASGYGPITHYVIAGNGFRGAESYALVIRRPRQSRV